jgi:NAD(P)-dependent dehydrogenase (short-subunit alcohol dehydrogenase family)
MNTPNSPVWFITGCSTGFGRALAQAVLDRGWRVVATARDSERVADLATGEAAERLLPLALDVTDADGIASAVQAAQKRFGAIDVLVNNAGYGYQSTVEEGVEEEIREQFDANVFGLFAVTRAVLPLMRERRHGNILNITSVAGLVGFQGSGYYAASKHAVEGWSDSLHAECKPQGIHVTCVEPGPFRTDWAGRSLRQTPSTISDYAETAASRMQATRQNSGRQAGDPQRAAEAMITITQSAAPPRHLVLGAMGVKAVTSKLKERLEEIEAWRETGLATDFPA